MRCFCDQPLGKRPSSSAAASASHPAMSNQTRYSRHHLNRIGQTTQLAANELSSQLVSLICSDVISLGSDHLASRSADISIRRYHNQPLSQLSTQPSSHCFTLGPAICTHRASNHAHNHPTNLRANKRLLNTTMNHRASCRPSHRGNYETTY